MEEIGSHVIPLLYCECPFCKQRFKLMQAKLFYVEEEVKDVVEGLRKEVEEIRNKYDELIKAEREDATNRARATIEGFILERFALFLPGFKYYPSDAHYIGEPIDYVVFNGASVNKEVSEIVFIEIKKSSSILRTKVEKSIEKAIEEKRVRYELLTSKELMGKLL